MIDKAANFLGDDDPNKLTKRKCTSQNEYLAISSSDIAARIVEADVQNTLFGSDNGVQIKRTRMGGSLEYVDLAITDEIPNTSSLTGIKMSSLVDTGVALSSASQNSSDLMNDPATKIGKESSLGTEADAARTCLSDSELREQNEQDPEKSYSGHAAGGSTLISEVIMSGNGQIDRIKKKSLSDELANFLPKPVPAKRKKLLVLDINGLLADIVSPIPKDYKSDTNIARRAIFKRPFCTEFLTFCFETFYVGIWSSRTQKNVERVIEFLLGDLKDRLFFCWDVTQCTTTGFHSLENRHKTLMFKEIRKLWEPQDHGLPWEIGRFNESNTLLVDDSPYKALLNPQHTAIFPQSYNYQDRYDTSLGLGGHIRGYLEGLAAAEHAQQYVEKHPFGQGIISQSSPSWDFYYKAIISLFTLLTPNA